jgi:hypothetical protein
MALIRAVRAPNSSPARVLVPLERQPSLTERVLRPVARCHRRQTARTRGILRRTTQRSCTSRLLSLLFPRHRHVMEGGDWGKYSLGHIGYTSTAPRSRTESGTAGEPVTTKE